MRAFLRCSLAIAVAAAVAGAGRADDDLTGTWYGPDGITHSVRQIGKDVWWVAKSGDEGKTFTSVFRGKLDDNKLTGDFADVPEGKNLHSGTLKAKLVVKDGKVTAVEGEIVLAGSDAPVAWSISRTKSEK